jgi:hypothetical protein
MRASWPRGCGGAEDGRVPAVPPLPAEDHVCARCALAYRELTLDEAAAMVAAVPGLARVAVRQVPAAALRRRPEPAVWSVVEYLCHLRDVHVAATIRLHRARTEERPVLEPMLNDLRVRRFRYADSDVAAVLDELTAAVAGVGDEVRRLGPGGWDRTVTRLPGEERTARWLLRHAAHEGRHHLDDVRLVGSAAAALTAQE